MALGKPSVALAKIWHEVGRYKKKSLPWPKSLSLPHGPVWAYSKGYFGRFFMDMELSQREPQSSTDLSAPDSAGHLISRIA